MNVEKYEVPFEKLRLRVDPSELQFESTKQLTPLQEFIGQDRAIKAIEFGLNMKHPGYNIYVSGLTGTGRASMVKAYIQKIISEKEKKEGPFHPRDWCYIYNFDDPDRPLVVDLPQGMGKTFREDMQGLLKRLREALQKSFTSEEYAERRKRLIEEGQKTQRDLISEMERAARESGFLLQLSPIGPVLVPMVQNRPMSQEEYLSLSEEQRKDLEARRLELSKRIEEGLERVRELERNVAQKLQQTDRQVAEYSILRPFREISEKYSFSEVIQQFLKDLKTHTLNNLDLFKQPEAVASQAQPMGEAPIQLFGGRVPFLPFQVNVFVDNSETSGPPVVFESNPTFTNLFGKIERRFFLGAYVSDHTMIKAGAISLANEGYLILNVRDVLLNPGVWEALKRAIKNKEVRIEDPFEQFGLIAPQGLRPQPMPLDLKVILIGERYIYNLLSAFDEDFWEIFRVKADFDFEIERTQENVAAYASFVCSCCEEAKLRHFDSSAVAKVIELGSRLAEDQRKLTSRFAQIKEVLVEADYWASVDGSELVSARHVEKAIKEKIYRHNLVEEKIREMITRGLIMIDVDGKVVGQVNGLSIHVLGDIVFGRPSRITAKVFLGRDGIVNIERESQLSGKIHDKGVLILGGYIGWKYAQDKPLSLSATICFEQSYEGVEGDSASSAELYAIISSLAGVPLRQDIAVTGSVNQKGEIQPIGGVNQKIEGFFRVCKEKGLTGTQGVMIPHQNLVNLMLDEEVVEAVKGGKFHIYAVKTIDEGLEVLTGLEAGQRRDDGTYPEGTVNYLVDKRLAEMAKQLKEFYEEEKEKK